jgi:predicted dehydrogenase/aryl-alcohol dehydrogenase-like predicted oxidoreductase
LSTQTLNWGILSTGKIARAFADGLNKSLTGKLVAVASRSLEPAQKFAADFAKDGVAPKAFGSYQAMLDDPTVQAVYIATPHPMHAEWTVKAAQAGKHILVEKPIGSNHAEAMVMIEAAVEHNVTLMEAYMVRCAPQTKKLYELIRDKAIGELRVIDAPFSFHWPKPYDPTSRLLANDLAGGGILDVGGYTISMARLLAGAALGLPFAEPIEIQGMAVTGQTGVDEWAVASLRFPGNILARCTCGVQCNQDNVLKLFGSEGQIIVPSPWVPAREGGTTTFTLKRYDEKDPQTITVDSPRQIYALEADAFAAGIPHGRVPEMTPEDTLGNAKVMEEWRKQAKVTYDFEKPENLTYTLSRQPLKLRDNHNMTYGRIAGLDKPISRLFMGVDNITTAPHIAAMFDDFYSRGGNAFDTAFIYGGGRAERALGQWVKNRGLRDKIVILTKGAHTPFCTPQHLDNQFKESLERLQMDHVDLYAMHRDNPDVPVGEFVDVINRHVKAGRIKIYGGSNWSIQRIEAANAYAKKHGLQGFSLVSNNFSLARMVNPIWAGSISASTPEWRAWLTQHQFPILSWSSQARGFFLPGRAAPDKTSDSELVNTWYAPDNFQRLERVNKLATEKNTAPINIALAYVLCQPFPTFALFGPRQLSETRTSLPGLDIKLSEAEIKWLNLESDKI